ncbi:uncharacterized protein V2V93DRAFT_368494 [Kockiozyma suomiensis]|uniref:uncharacterized protein n=1 Tax=Kockiozyma suomiensis TaxID=1337062 RepID=UPI0033431970
MFREIGSYFSRAIFSRLKKGTSGEKFRGSRIRWLYTSASSSGAVAAAAAATATAVAFSVPDLSAKISERAVSAPVIAKAEQAAAKAVSEVAVSKAKIIENGIASALQRLSFKFDVLYKASRVEDAMKRATKDTWSRNQRATILQTRRKIHYQRIEFQKLWIRKLERRNEIVSARQMVRRRIQSGRYDSRPDIPIELERAYTAQLTRLETRWNRITARSMISNSEYAVYKQLEKIGVPMRMLKMHHIDRGSSEFMRFMLTHMNNIRSPIYLLKHKPTLLDYNSAKLNKAITKVANSANGPIVLNRIGNALSQTQHVPNRDTFTIIIRRLVIIQNLSLAALIAFEAMLEAGFEASPETVVNLMKAAVDSNNAWIVELVFGVVLRQSKIDSINNDVMGQIFLNTKVIGALMTASIKLKAPRLYTHFREEFMRRKFQPTLETLTMELRYAFLVHDRNLAAEAWETIKFMDSRELLKLDAEACFWMMKTAERRADVKLMSEIVDVASERDCLTSLIEKAKRDTA